MDHLNLEKIVADLPIGGLRYYTTVGSTNDEAANWIREAAPDFSVIVADEQTQGRGRAYRKWYTFPGAALAFSIILHPTPDEKLASSISGRFAGLGALGVSLALQRNYQLPAKIKWPNDVLSHQKKCCGILAEAQWMGDELSAIILGIGINIAPGSIPPADLLRYPATCVENAIGHPLDRFQLFHDVLAAILYWRTKIMTPEFIQKWEENLAYQGEIVQIVSPGGQENCEKTIYEGNIIGLATDGALKILTNSGEIVTIQSGELHLRPLDGS